jgi:TP901 family phage tail tape measure protein
LADVNANIGVNIDTSEALAQLKSLQRQISQFHTSIAKSSESAALAQRDLQKNFLNSVNSIGAFSAELRTVKTTAESFTDSLQKNKFSMREYFRYAGASTKTFGKTFKSEFDTIGKVAEDRVKRLQTQYIKLGRDTSGAMKAIAIMPNQLDMNNFSTQSQIAAQKQAIFNQLVKQGSTNLLNFGKNTQWAGRQLMVGFTLPLATLGTVATRTFMEMEAQTLKFRKVYGDLFTPKEETQRALADITALGEMFTKYGIAVSQTVGLAAEAAAAGFSGIDLQRQTAEATRLSVLGQIESNKALETTISLQNAFKMSSDQLASSIDFLNAVENQTVVSLDDITTAIPKVAPVIQQLGGDVKDLAFFMAAMKEGGINASEGANALKSGLAALINPTEKASAQLAAYGINIKQIVEGNQGDLKTTVIEFAQALDTLDPLTRSRAIEQLFGKFQFARLSTLFSNVINETGQASRVLDLAGTSIEELAALSESELGMTADSAMNKFRKSVEDLKFALVPVGQTFLEAVTPIVEFVGGILEKFNNLSSGVKKAIVVLTVAIGAIGPIALMTFGLLANGLANIVKGLLVLRNGYLRLTGQTQVLGEQTEYLTMEQIDAAAASHSLDQSHARLVQTFTAESSAVAKLIEAYQQATVAGAKFAALNPGMMRAPGAPTKRAKGKPVVVGGTGNQDTELALLTPGETVIPAEMSKKYAALINGMIAGNIPGYRRGLGTGDTEFAQSIAGVAPQRSQAGVQAFLERELKAVPEQLVQDFKDLVTTISQEVKLSETALKERLKSFRAQYNANIGQQEELQFAHLDTGRRVKAGDLQSSGAIVDPKTQARLRTFIDAAGADALVDLKTGFGVELTGFLNNAMQGAGASLEDAIADFKIGGVDKFRKSIAMGGGNMEDLGPELAAFDARFQQNLEQAYSQGATIIVDSQAQIEQMRQEALVKGESFDDTIYVAMDTVAEQTRQNVLQLGSGLDAVFEEAKNRITEIRFQGLTPEQNAGLPAGFSRGSKGGRITPGATSYGRGSTVVGSFANAPLAQQSVANVDAAILATAQAAGTQSPSRKTIPIGEDIARGLQVGMANQQDEVAASGQALGAAAVSGTQSGGGRQRRIGTSPGGTVGPGGTINPMNVGISPAMKEAIDTEITARKTSAQRIDSMNKGLMAGTFALTSLASVGSMAGGTIGNLSQQVMKFSGLLFALMSITQLLTQTKIVALAAERAATAGLLVQNVQTKAFSKTPGLFAGGIKQLLPNLVKFGSMLIRMAGPVGLVVGGLTSAYLIFKKVNAIHEENRKRLEAFGDAVQTSAEQLKSLGDYFGVVPQKSPLESAKLLEIVAPETRNAREQFKASETFQQFLPTVEAVGKLNDKQAEQALQFRGIELLGQGFSKDQVQIIIDSIKEEAGKQNLVIDFKGLDFNEEQVKQIGNNLKTTMTKFNNAFKSGLTEETITYYDVNVGKYETITRKIIGPEAKAALTNQGKAMKAYLNGLSGMLANGTITTKKFDSMFNAFTTNIKKNVPDSATQIRLLNAALSQMESPLAKSALGIKSATDKMLLLQAAMVNVTSITPAMIAQLEAAARSTDGGAARAANRVRAKISKEIKENKAAIEAALKDSQSATESATKTGVEKFSLTKYLNDNIKAINAQTDAFKAMRVAGISAAAASELASNPDAAKAIVALAKAGGNAWKDATKLIRQYRSEQVELEKTLRAGASAGDYELSRLNMAQKYIALQEHLIDLQTSPKIKEYNKSIEFQELVLKNISNQMKAINENQIFPRETLIKQNNYKLEELSFIEDDINKAYEDQSKALRTIERLNTNIASIQKSRLTIADALSRGDISAAAIAIEQARQEQSANSLSNAQEQLDLNKELAILAVGRKNIEEQNKILQFQISQIQKTQLDAMELATSKIQNNIDLLSYELSLEEKIAQKRKESITYFGMTSEQINNAVKSLELAKDAGINIDITENLTAFINAAKGDVTALNSLLTTTVPAAAKTAFDELTKLRDAMDLSATITVTTSADGAVASIETVRAALAALNAEAAKAASGAIVTAQVNINSISFADLNSQWQLAQLSAQAYFDAVAALADGVISDAEIAAFAAKWGIPTSAAKAYFDAVAALADGKITDAEIAAFATKWGIPTTAAAAYFSQVATSAGVTIDTSALVTYATAWSSPTTAAESYFSSVSTGVAELSLLDYSSPGNSAASAWNSAAAAAKAYATAAAAAASAQIALNNAKAASQTTTSSTTAVPTKTETTSVYTVKTGDTLSEIAAANGLTLKEILAANPKLTQDEKYDDGNMIWAGTKVNIPKKNSGGLIKGLSYMRLGGMAKGSDTVPTLLTPGEFVVRRSAVQDFGVKNLEKINSGEHETGSVYNYSLSVNVNSDADPDDIARAVITQIRQIDSQRVRGQRA